MGVDVWRFVALCLLVACALSRKLTQRKADWNDPDIVVEDHEWFQLPTSLFEAGEPQPYAPSKSYRDESVRNASSIIVLVASHRETRTANTLHSIFQRARLPSRVFVGVVQQNDAADEDALEGLCRKLGTPLVLKKSFRRRKDLHRRQSDEDLWGHGRYSASSLAACEPAKRVRVFRMAAEEAKGPAYARARQPLLLGGDGKEEDFCMQIDAHTNFVRHWDDEVVRQWALTDNEYAVLSTYPTNAAELSADGEARSSNDHWEMPHLCTAAIEAPGVVRNDQAGAAAMLTKPPLSKFWAAGLSFSRCHAERDVPNDPELRHIFSGEEFSRGARLWTNGYDFYSLARPVVGTFYGNEKGEKGHWKEDSLERRSAVQRLQALLQVESGADAAATGDLRAGLKGFDLGKRRRFDDYIKLTGVDVHRGVVTNTPCSVTHWVPWLPDAPPAYRTLPESPALLGVDIRSRMLEKSTKAKQRRSVIRRNLERTTAEEA
eukprot:TRINITY_DN31545_c0_g1_i1.p1 TRINITY_DN31545_c0_g1~~TRINITY_DN31545_c0_g1_i1.p1  ORF type:complete len:490 (+),score=110.96 TRINITY_DN31545_c0_g1_i1:44-1513(+)